MSLEHPRVAGLPPAGPEENTRNVFTAGYDGSLGIRGVCRIAGRLDPHYDIRRNEGAKHCKEQELLRHRPWQIDDLWILVILRHGHFIDLVEDGHERPSISISKVSL